MIVTCNECESSFNVDDSLIKDGGSKVRCSKCSQVFVVHPETAGSAEIEEDFSLEMDADLDSDEEFEGLAVDDDTDDELPDLEDMMEFEDDDLALEAPAGEDSDELELDLELEAPDADSAAIDEVFGEDEEELDLDFGLDEESMAEEDDADLGHVEAADDDLPDLEMGLEELDQPDESESVAIESDLDLDMEADEDLPVAAEDGADELDLSDLEDLVASDEEIGLEDVTAEVSADADLDLDMDMDLDEVETVATEAVAAEDGADELDLSDLEDLVDSAEEVGLEDMPIEAAEDMDLDIEVEPEETAATADAGTGAVESDELDLSDLDDIVDAGEEPTAEDVTADASDDLELDLDLTEGTADEELAVESDASAAGADELDLSDLDGLLESDEPSGDDLTLDFEVDEDQAEPAPTESPAASEELEMSDLEQMLESDETPASGDAAELDLDLDLESSEAAAGGDDAEFLDIEKMLEESDETASADKEPGDVAEIDLEAVMGETSESAEPELELNLDLDGDLQEAEADSALDISASDEDDLEFKLLDSDEETLQFGATQAAATMVEDDLTASSDLGSSTDDFATDDFDETRDLYGQTDTIDSMAGGMGVPVKKRKTSKPVLVAFLLLLLSLLGIIVTNNLGIKIPYVSDINIPYISDVKIPYLSGLMKSQSKDLAGNLKIAPIGGTITYKFVENAQAGKIFVITGQVRNEYDHPRSNIKITGKLYRRGKALAKTATVYCGNLLSDADLARMDISAISKRLQNRFGDNRSNIKVKTGKTIPFVIVFNQLPANLDEYTVEVAGSTS